jgi:hypothetical protein
LAHRQGTRLEGYHDLLIGCDEPRRESSQPEGSLGGSDSSGAELAHRNNEGLERYNYGNASTQQAVNKPANSGSSSQRSAWPSRPGQPQYGWEPPRVVGNAERGGRESGHGSRARAKESRAGRESGLGRVHPDSTVKSPLGGDSHGSPSGLGYAELPVACEDRNTELSVACDNRTDELRLLGNGVVPATCSLAFRTLLYEAYALQLSSGC